MGKKCFVMTLAVFAFGFGTALRSNAGTDMVEPYQAPARSYNYAPPPRPRPVFFVPPVRFGIAFGPGFGYYGPRYGFSGAHRFHGRQQTTHGLPTELGMAHVQQVELFGGRVERPFPPRVVGIEQERNDIVPERVQRRLADLVGQRVTHLDPRARFLSARMVPVVVDSEHVVVVAVAIDDDPPFPGTELIRRRRSRRSP